MSSGRTRRMPLPSFTSITTTVIRGTGVWDSTRSGPLRTGGIIHTTVGRITIPGSIGVPGITDTAAMEGDGTTHTIRDTTGGTAIPTAPTTAVTILPDRRSDVRLSGAPLSVIRMCMLHHRRPEVRDPGERPRPRTATGRIG